MISGLKRLGREGFKEAKDRVMDIIDFYESNKYTGAGLRARVNMQAVFCPELFNLGKDEYYKLAELCFTERGISNE